MKVFVVDNNYRNSCAGNDVGWFFLSDSAVSNTGKPFYLPDDYGATAVALSIAIRFNRLGKGISPQFASRYYFECAPALHFYLPEYENVLKKEGLPSDQARNFDKSLFVGEFRSFKDESFQLRLNHKSQLSFELKELKIGVDEIISRISLLNTIKMGDILLPGLSPAIFPLKEGDLLEVYSNDEKEFHVRVK